MNNKLYGVGVGPGKGENITIRALDVLKSSAVVVLPGSGREKCIAYDIVKEVYLEIDEKKLVFCDFPMTKDEAILKYAHQKVVGMILEELKTGRDVSFVTLGDPCVYSTFSYIFGEVERRGFEVDIVSAVTSICAVAAKLHISLGDGDEQLHIIPGSYDISNCLQLKGTVCFMKSGKSLTRLIEYLKRERDEYCFDFYAVSNCNLASEAEYRNIDEVLEELPYLTIVILKNIRYLGKHYEFVQNRECEYFPCHKIKDDSQFNCLFCYCPLYGLKDKCGGNFQYTASGIKSCIDCAFPHYKSNYKKVISKLMT